MTTRNERFVAASTCGLEAAVALYALMRIVQTLVTNEPNPANVIIQSVHGYFWRAGIAAYGGGFVALAIGLVSRAPERMIRIATRALPGTALLLAAQALFLP